MGIFWFYFASIFDKDEYGELGYILSIGTIGFAFASFGLYSLVVVYGAKKENVFVPAFTLGILTTSVASLVVFILTQNIFLVLMIWGSALFNLMTANLISKKQYVTFSKYNLLRRTLVLFFAIILYPIFDLTGILVGFFLATFPAFKDLYLYFKSEKISILVLRPKMGFILNSYFLELTTLFFWWGDKLIIAPMMGFMILGSYQVAIQFMILLNAIPIALSAYLLPQESEGKKNSKVKIYAIMFSIFLALMSVFFVPFGINLFLPHYEESIVPIQIMSFGIIPLTISAIYESSFLGKQKSRFAITAIALQTSFYFSLLIVLGNEYGIIGIAIAFLISTIVRAIFYKITQFYTNY